MRGLLVLFAGFLFWLLMEQVYGLYATGVWLPFVGWVGVRPFGFVRQYGVLFGVAFAVAADWMIDKATK